MTPLYDVFLVRPNGAKPQRLGVVRAVRQRSHAGNWFPHAGENGNGDFMTPCPEQSRECIPYRLRKAWYRTAMIGHSADNLHASTTLRDTRGRHLCTIRFEGYEYA